ncbi:MAG: ribosome-associated translation inhibitor RaiA [Clostridia bacterium]
MKLDLTGIHVEITEGINDFVQKKVEKLEKFFDSSTICHVTISVEKENKLVDIRIEYKGRTYLAKEIGEDMYYSLEKVIEKIEGQARKTKALIEKKRREGIAEEVLDKLTLEETLKEE